MSFKEAQRAAKGKHPSSQAPDNEQKATGTVEATKDSGNTEPTQSKTELRAERRAKQVYIEYCMCFSFIVLCYH